MADNGPGIPPDQLEREDDFADWQLSLEIVQTGESTNTIYWCRWSVAPSNRPSLVTELCLRAPPLERYAGALKSGGLGSLIKSIPVRTSP